MKRENNFNTKNKDTRTSGSKPSGKSAFFERKTNGKTASDSDDFFSKNANSNRQSSFTKNRQDSDKSKTSFSHDGGYKSKTTGTQNENFNSQRSTNERSTFKGKSQHTNDGNKRFAPKEEPVYKSNFNKNNGERPTFKDFDRQDKPAYKGTKDNNFSQYEKKSYTKSNFEKNNFEDKGDKKHYTKSSENFGEGFKKTYANDYKKNDGGFNTLSKNKVGTFKGRFEEKVATIYQDEHIEYSHNKRQQKMDALPTQGEQMPLNKYVARCGICGRREAVEIIKSGKVKVNGKVWLEPSYHVLPADTILYNDNKIVPQENLIYVLLNKPKDFITTLSDEQGRKTVMDLVANACEERIYPVGRLDRNTSGLLLLTNDGVLAQKLMHPSFVIKKIYQVGLNKALEKIDFEKIIAGLQLEDGMAQVDDLAYIEASDKSKIGIQIHNGKNRIVRRIFESLGYDVEQLDRVLYANLTKKNLPRGKWRFLDEKEIRILKHFNSK